jgi:carbonic anhydrase/acetyltransferase-like protein (isoleucine patch superfamily)
MLIPYKGRLPQVDATALVQDSAQVIGDVAIGAHSSVWFNVVIRGDVHHIRIGARTNIQDNSTVHGTRGRWPVFVGDDVTVAHGVTLHGCTIADRCLIGIGAIVMDGAEIGEDCIVAAGALVTPGTKIPAGQLVIGSPAAVARPLRPEEIAHLKQSALNYVAYAESYQKSEVRTKE